MDFVTGEILYIDKPLRWTSFDVVKRIRGALLRRLKRKKFKVGHAGTLDPLATGVVIVVTGKATRLIEQLQAGVKEYIATIAVGATTPSFDLEKEIDAYYPNQHVSRQLVEQTLPRFVGEIQQVPPAFSACKIEGERAYEMARRGDEVNLAPKTLVIEELELLDWDDEAKAMTVRVVCSKGTYIRALARDIGQALDSGAHLTALRRTRVGDVRAEQCVSPEQAAKIIAETPLEFPDDYDYPIPTPTLSVNPN